MNKTLFTIIILLSLPIHTEDPSIYSYIASQYMSSMDSDDFSIPPKEDKDSFDVEQLTEAEKCMIAFKVLGKIDAAYLPSHAVIDLNTWQNLELFSQANLLGVLKRTSTKLGEVTLARMLADPTTNIRELVRRQKIIRTLVEDEALFMTLDSSLEAMKSAESVFLSFWQEENPLNREAFRRFYYADWLSGSKWLNINSFALSVVRRAEDIGSLLLLPLAALYVRYLINDNVLLKLNKHKENFINPRNTANLDEHKGIIESQPNALLNLLYRAGDLGIGIIEVPLSIYQTITYFEFSRRALKHIHNKMSNLAVAINGLHIIHNVTSMHKEELKDLYECQLLNDLFDNPECNSPNLDTLLHNLESRTFKHGFSYIESGGKILSTYRLMEKTKNELIHALEVIGIIDAYMSIARLLREFENKKVKFCFTELHQEKRPYISMNNFWYPIVNQNKVVVNSVELGNDDGSHNIIITGQNTGGKSTILKSIATNLVLAQTFGIAAAEECKLTPFTTINTYMNVTDNAKEGKSLFASEVARAKALLERISSLKPHEKSFSVIDEAFKGTGGEAQDLSYWYALKIGKFANSMAINATHYPKLTTLEDETNGLYKNYKVEVKVTDDGKLIRPFKLEQGYTLYNIAQHILTEQGLL